MVYKNVWLADCVCEVNERDDLFVYVNGVLVGCERGCGFNRDIVYNILEVNGYL